MAFDRWPTQDKCPKCGSLLSLEEQPMSPGVVKRRLWCTECHEGTKWEQAKG